MWNSWTKLDEWLDGVLLCMYPPKDDLLASTRYKIFKERKQMWKTTTTSIRMTIGPTNLFSFTDEGELKIYLREKLISGEMTKDEAQDKLTEWRRRSAEADEVLGGTE